MKTPRNQSLAVTCVLLVLALTQSYCTATPRAPEGEVAIGRPQTLAIAFEVASRIPANPHARDRARMQGLVVEACIELGMLDAATTYARSISDWRRGEALALIAQCHAASGTRAQAEALLETALLVAAGERDWRRERIRVAIAKAELALGNETRALELTGGMSPAELGRIEVARTEFVDAAKFDERAELFDRAIATKNFDLARSAIDGYLVMLGRITNDDARSTRAKSSIEAAIVGLPLDLQVIDTVQLARVLFARQQKDAAEAALAHACDLFAKTTFLAEDLAPLGVVIARAHLALGHREAAEGELRHLRAQCESRQREIVDVRRARSFRDLAEAFEEVGDHASAMRCYAQALDAGSVNPNARPRAEDLCATCVSMARAGVAPTPALVRRIDSIRTSLVDPW